MRLKDFILLVYALEETVDSVANTPILDSFKSSTDEFIRSNTGTAEPSLIISNASELVVLQATTIASNSWKSSHFITSNAKPLISDLDLEQNFEYISLDELDTKLNLLINNLNKDKGENNKVNNRTETNNIYDIILFVIFGLFVLLLLESLTKLISKNIVKYEPSNAIKGVME